MEEEIYLRNVKMVYKICLTYLKNVSDAEDETANVFLAYLRKPQVFENREHEKAWFIISAKNRCKNVLKSFWKIRRVDIENLPESLTENDEDNALLEELFKLKEKYRIVLYLHYYEGYKTEEIANLLGINPNTVRTRLVKARKDLKHILKEECCYG